ncbi:hypothetical protein D9M68_921410 [compost metagenome]
MIVSTSAPMATRPNRKKPITTTISSRLIAEANATVIWKFSASLPWASMNGSDSRLSCQSTSGPISVPNGIQIPNKADR